jgi:hypothetical protein
MRLHEDGSRARMRRDATGKPCPAHVVARRDRARAREIRRASPCCCPPRLGTAKSSGTAHRLSPPDGASTARASFAHGDLWKGLRGARHLRQRPHAHSGAFARTSCSTASQVNARPRAPRTHFSAVTRDVRERRSRGRTRRISSPGEALERLGGRTITEASVMANSVDIPRRARAPQCRACAAITSEEAWNALPLHTTIPVDAIVPRIVTRWSGAPIQVRSCRACGRLLSRRAPQREERGAVQ